MSQIDRYKTLWQAYREARRAWLKDETENDFDEELSLLFQELDSFFEIPVGN